MKRLTGRASSRLQRRPVVGRRRSTSRGEAGRETVERTAPPAAHYRRHAMPRRHYYRRHYGTYARAAGPPNILALPFMALHGIFGR